MPGGTHCRPRSRPPADSTTWPRSRSAGQQHGMVVLDAEGRVIRDALLWNDTRSAAQAARDLHRRVGAATSSQRTGSVPVAIVHVDQAALAARRRARERGSRRRGRAAPRLADLAAARLRPARTRRLDELTTDRSDASGTGYWSTRATRRVRPRAARRRPRPRRDPAARARTRGESAGNRLRRAWSSAPGAGDNAGAALGLGAVARRRRRLDRHERHGLRGHRRPRRTTRPARSRASPTRAALFLPLVATLNAARVLDSIAALLGVDHDELGRLALAAEPGAGGLVLQPYFEGERTPNLPDATATLFGMTLASTTRAEPRARRDRGDALRPRRGSWTRCAPTASPPSASC